MSVMGHKALEIDLGLEVELKQDHRHNYLSKQFLLPNTQRLAKP